MLKLIINNSFTTIEGEVSPDWKERKEFSDKLRVAVSYQIPNVDFSPKYKEGFWDGRITLWDWRTKTFPSGCIMRVARFLQQEKIPFEIIDKRRKPSPNTKLVTTFAEHGRELRFYQQKAVDEAVDKGRGIISLATGGGKTMLSCELLAQLSVTPFLFYVPSTSLLKQTHKELTKYLKQNDETPHIGFIGDSVYDINMKGINVLTYQTALLSFNEKYIASKDKVEQDELAGEKIRKTLKQLEQEQKKAEKEYTKALKEAETKYASLKTDPTAKPKDFDRAVNKEVKPAKEKLTKAKKAVENRVLSNQNKAKVRNLVENAKGFIVDEAHTAAVIIETLSYHADNAYFRIGLSATPFREDNQEIRMEAAMGRKLVEITCSDLIDLGYLVPPKIYMVKVNHYERSIEYRDAYKKHIVECWERNYRIKQFAEAFKAQGRPVLILVEQIPHGYILEEMIKDAVFVPGKEKGEDDPDSEEQDYRRRMLNETEKNNIILIATQWAYVGIDAPAISTLILAGSGQSTVQLYQMVGRVLRASPDTGKTEAVIVDFMDKEPDLHNHSLRRKRVYQNERSWQFKLIK